MSWLLDTNVVSQFAPDKSGRSRISPGLASWTRANEDQLYLSALSIAEVTSGIAKLRRQGSGHYAAALAGWLDQIISLYAERILAIDTATAQMSGELSDRALARGRHPGLSDILIAATAIAHGHGLLTVNVRHFEPLDLGIAIVNPLAGLPSSGSGQDSLP